MTPQQRTAWRFALGTLVYNVLVILWGAFVRATGSGAGCGAHWPTCNGEVIPRPEQVETLIEFTHRLTSGLALLATIAMLVLVLRAFSKGHRARRAAWASMGFMVGEAAVGAALVLLELVAHNDSLARAAVMGVHLVNTFLLLGAFVLTVHWSRGGLPVRLAGQGRAGLLLGLTLVAMLIVGATGGITALGDTLFPAGSLAEGLAQDVSPTAHFLLRLRVLHPALAVATGVMAVVTALPTGRGDPTWPRLVVGLVVAQLGAGVVNLVLLAPVWMQIVHLLLADLLWMALVMLAATRLALPTAQRAAA